MSDTTIATPVAPTAAPAATPTPTPHKRTRSSVNQRHATELALARSILGRAKKTDYAPKLVNEGIGAEFVTKLEAKIDEADKLLAGAGGKTADKRPPLAAKKRSRRSCWN